MKDEQNWENTHEEYGTTQNNDEQAISAEISEMVNRSDITSVICANELPNEIYGNWFERKNEEYDTYYSRYNNKQRPSIDTMRDYLNRKYRFVDFMLKNKKIAKVASVGAIIIGAGALAFFTGEWGNALCALLFAFVGYLSK